MARLRSVASWRHPGVAAFWRHLEPQYRPSKPSKPPRAQELTTRLDNGEEAAAGIIQHAVLMGLPASSDPAKWRRLKRVVAGRLINVTRLSRLEPSDSSHAHTMKSAAGRVC